MKQKILTSGQPFFGPHYAPETFGGRAPPGPAGGAHSAPPDPLAALRGTASRWGPLRDREGGREGKGREREEKERKGERRRGEGREERERGRKGKGEGEGTYSPAPSPYKGLFPGPPDNTPLSSSDTPTFEFLYKNLDI
jgi:hypothetical protein